MILSAHCPQSEDPPLRRRAIDIARKPHRLWSASSPALLLVALIGLPEAGVAGTGRLLSSWMTQAPAIDGEIGAAEWAEAAALDLGDGITLRIGNDARTLYLALLDPPDNVSSTAMTFRFDDEGGSPPQLDDSAWLNPACQSTPSLGEGYIYFEGGDEPLYAEWWSNAQSWGFCDDQSLVNRLSFAAAGTPLRFEIALPLDGPSPLRAAAGQRFGFQLIIQDWYSGSDHCYPAGCNFDPSGFRNLVLASGGCNTGPQEFGAGDPQIGLPLDWTSEITVGNGPGWSQSLPPFYGAGTFCESNDTGGAGAAACVANALDSLPNTDSLLRMPLPLAGQTSATVRLRAKLVVDPSGVGPYDSLSLDLLRQDGTANHQLVWSGQDESGNVVLPLDLGGSPPVELLFTHSTLYAGGLEGGYAQVDDVELLCGPILFADDFESGLTTHWSATTP